VGVVTPYFKIRDLVISASGSADFSGEHLKSFWSEGCREKVHFLGKV